MCYVCYVCHFQRQIITSHKVEEKALSEKLNRFHITGDKKGRKMFCKMYDGFYVYFNVQNICSTHFFPTWKKMLPLCHRTGKSNWVMHILTPQWIYCCIGLKNFIKGVCVCMKWERDFNSFFFYFIVYY